MLAGAMVHANLQEPDVSRGGNAVRGKQMKRKSRDARDDAWEPQPSALRERSAGRRAVEAVDCVVVAEVKAGGA